MKLIKNIFAITLMFGLVFAVFTNFAKAASPWNVTGNYEITFHLDGDPDETVYVHHAELVQSGNSVTGDGGYPATGPESYHWTASGNQTADDLDLTVEYTLGAFGTTMNMDGAIASDGTISGTWTDNLNGGSRFGTWFISKGVSVPRIHTPANNAVVEQSDMVKVDWTDAVGANPPFVYMYEAYANADYTGLIYASGWLSDSEKLTPGTPIGDYYLRVKAKNNSGVESDWSNTPVNPHHVKVVADSVNPFDVPLACDQNIVYNKIEGTNGDNNINGTNGADLILAYGGNDKVNGYKGNDCIVGGEGNDTLNGGDGMDTILAGNGNDTVNGGNGNDELFAEGGLDTVNGGNNNDMIDGGTHKDTLIGGNGNDVIEGDEGDDSINGGNGNDTINSGDGKDNITAGNGNDTVNAGNGDDTLSGGNGNDVLNGEIGEDKAYGQNGNDTCSAEDEFTCEV